MYLLPSVRNKTLTIALKPLYNPAAISEISTVLNLSFSSFLPAKNQIDANGKFKDTKENGQRGRVDVYPQHGI